MPIVVWRPDWNGTQVSADDDVFVTPNGAGLRPNWSVVPPDCPAEGTLTFPNWRVGALTELRAITPVVRPLHEDLTALYAATVQEAGAIDCRLSVDNGVTWLTWNAAWVPAGVGEWTSFKDLNLNLATIPFVERQLRLQVRMRRGTNPRLGPVLKRVQVSYGVLPDHQKEDPHRTVMQFYLDHLELHMRDVYALAAPAAAVPLEHPVAAASVVKAFNLTDDPTRLMDVSTGAVVGGAAVLTSAQEGDIEVEWLGTPRVELANPDLDMHTAEAKNHVPCLLIQIMRSAEDPDQSFPEVGGAYSINVPRKLYWREEYPRQMNYQVNVYALAADEVLSLKLIDAAYRLLKDYANQFPLFTVLGGTEAEAFKFTPPFANLTETSQNLSVKMFSFTLYVTEWRGALSTGPLAEELEVVLEE